MISHKKHKTLDFCVNYKLLGVEYNYPVLNYKGEKRFKIKGE